MPSNKLGTQPQISFVVVTHDRPKELVWRRIVQSIARQVRVSFDLYLIGDDCATVEHLANDAKACYPLLPVYWHNVPRASSDTVVNPRARAAKCRNIGVSLSSAEFISCQDDDNELEPYFASSLLEALLAANAEAAHSYRRLVMPDGSPFQGNFFPWARPGSVEERLLFEMWRACGAISPGSSTIKDQLLAANGSEVFSTVDANEWLVKRHILSQFPFREKYGYYDLMGNRSFDDIWNLDIRAAGVRVACDHEPNLIYHLGGQSNAAFVDHWRSGVAQFWGITGR